MRRYPQVLRLAVLWSLAASMFCTVPAGASSLSVRHDELLQRRGSGVFRYLGMKLYEAQLYDDPAHRSSRPILSDVPKRLTIRYFRDIPAKAIIQAAEKNMRNNPDVNYERIRDRVAELNRHYKDVREGDEYSLTFSRGVTRLELNGRLKTEIKGEDFAAAYFGIWLSEHAISSKLRKKLLSI